MHFAVIGHVEWVEFAPVDHVPTAGEIVHAGTSFEEVAGGGGVAAVTLARAAGAATLFTAVGSDDLGIRVSERLRALGVTLRAARREGATRRALTLLDPQGERTITTLGERLEPNGSDALGWEDLEGADGAFVTAGDESAMKAARTARVLVASARAALALHAAQVEVDALVLSRGDTLEQERAALLNPRWLVITDGPGGGSYIGNDGSEGGWQAALPSAPIANTYGCGDTFAAALTYALGLGFPIDAATTFAAEHAASCLIQRGPFAEDAAAAGG